MQRIVYSTQSTVGTVEHEQALHALRHKASADDGKRQLSVAQQQLDVYPLLG